MGLDVCIFCMYVQEYDGDDDYDSSINPRAVQSSHAKRVYVAYYIDSVEHFRPRDVRTDVYHEILIFGLVHPREEIPLSFGTIQPLREHQTKNDLFNGIMEL